MAIFPTFFFRQYSPWKCILWYSRTKKRLSKLKKTRSSKSRKINSFPKGLTHGFGPKMTNFPTFFFRNIGQENVFYDILKQKNAFLYYKNKEFKQSKNCHFSKGVNPWFFYTIYTTKMYSMIFYNQKTPFEAKKTRSSNSPKINIFPKGLTHGFGPKMAIFPTFFFRQYSPWKCRLWYSRTKKLLSSL